MNRIGARHIWLTLFVAVCSGLAFQASADGNIRARLESDLQHIKASAARSVDFLLLDGATNTDDAAQVAAFVGPRSDLNPATDKEITSAFGAKEQKHILFRAFPYKVSTGTSKQTRNICIIKFDYSTHYSLDKLLSLLKTNRAILTANGIDLKKVTADRLLTHIWHHEVWHCLDMLEGKAPSYAFMLDNASYPMETLYAAYKRFTEIGADVFASLLDIQQYGDPEMSKLIAYVRKQNLQVRDLEHYSSPALDDVVQNYSDEAKTLSLNQVVAATDIVRQKYTASLDEFASMKDAYDPEDSEEGPSVSERAGATSSLVLQ
jgi:hypothetical protein